MRIAESVVFDVVGDGGVAGGVSAGQVDSRAAGAAAEEIGEVVVFQDDVAGGRAVEVSKEKELPGRRQAAVGDGGPDAGAAARRRSSMPLRSVPGGAGRAAGVGNCVGIKREVGEPSPKYC